MDPLLLFIELMQAAAQAPPAPAPRKRAPAASSASRRAPAPAPRKQAPPAPAPGASRRAPRWIVASAADALDARRARVVVAFEHKRFGQVIEVWIGDTLGGVALVMRARRAELDQRARVLKFEVAA